MSKTQERRISAITDRNAVLAAVEEFDQIGQQAFLAKYAFGPSVRYLLALNGKYYDSKAIVGAAYGFQFPSAGPLAASDFSGGGSTVKRLLERLNFTVEIATPDEADNGWTDDQLQAAIMAYRHMQEMDTARVKYSKKDIYAQLAKQHGRTIKAFEFRVQNISAVLNQQGRRWVQGLKPKANVGVHITARIERLLAALEGATSDSGRATFETKVAAAMTGSSSSIPTGRQVPTTIGVMTKTYVRDPTVKAWVLRAANWTCEMCAASAPFVAFGGQPFLEVHHVRRLCDQGSDTVTNAVALCPNCHRALHYAEDRTARVEVLYKSVPRLIRE